MTTHARLRAFAQRILFDWRQREALERILEQEEHECLDTAIQFICWNQIPGDYLEFGCFSGNTLTAVNRMFNKYRARVANALTGDDKAAFLDASPRLFAFDSFQGLPSPDGPDTHPYAPKHWKKAAFSMSVSDFERQLVSHGVTMENVRVVDGWYAQSLTAETRVRHRLRLASLVNIDCDLYDSAILCLDFIAPVIQDGTVIVFDDYNFYRGSPALGERLAFREWLERNPRISAHELCAQGFDKVAFFLSLSSG